ncbi:MAG: transposase [Synergistaceae bacterium]|nr:transposase [Synergistaceae bacterium]
MNNLKKGFEYYSGKKKRHTIKAQVIADYQNCNILSVDFSSGRKHDFALFKTTHNIIAENIFILADKGYHRIALIHENSLTLINKYNRKNLSAAEK